ncbi:DEAD/DEAH box helicase [Candidatus Bathyarchaeota archaeon]|nr:MAG: DEAD/DEAH box helicase [Candidatus Bathyarchaeota archaeon]
MAQQFEALGFQPRLLQGIKDMGFEEMFPIQAEAIAPILQGRDIIGQAHTGSGKTLAYALPILQRIDNHARGLQALVLVPTRAPRSPHANKNGPSLRWSEHRSSAEQTRKADHESYRRHSGQTS